MIWMGLPLRISKLVRLVGFEPTTSAFAGPRSIQTELQAQKVSGAEGEI